MKSEVSSQFTSTCRVGLGLRALKGGAALVAVALEDDEPRVLLSTFLATSAEGDRLSLEPYQVARELARSTQGEALQGEASARAAAAAAVAEGRARQDQLAADSLRHIVTQLGETPVIAALLVNRAGWITDLVEYSLAWQEHVPVAELLGVRDALRFALKENAIESIELDEKSLPDLAENALGLPPAEIDVRLKGLGTMAGRPWRKEQKLACLSAWIAAASSRDPRMS
jgi:hypothetical protein